MTSFPLHAPSPDRARRHLLRERHVRREVLIQFILDLLRDHWLLAGSRKTRTGSWPPRLAVRGQRAEDVRDAIVPGQDNDEGLVRPRLQHRRWPPRPAAPVEHPKPGEDPAELHPERYDEQPLHVQRGRRDTIVDNSISRTSTPVAATSARTSRPTRSSRPATAQWPRATTSRTPRSPPATTASSVTAQRRGARRRQHRSRSATGNHQHKATSPPTTAAPQPRWAAATGSHDASGSFNDFREHDHHDDRRLGLAQRGQQRGQRRLGDRQQRDITHDPVAQRHVTRRGLRFRETISPLLRGQPAEPAWPIGPGHPPVGDRGRWHSCLHP
ncbi:hypothetical protein HBB16_05835 [Pseudonocardia sp. MCCB 268]|nr:hypothetical protein [Pseudonocardia cytotoxica]